MYVRAENAHLLRNFIFAFFVAALVSLSMVNSAFAVSVSLECGNRTVYAEDRYVWCYTRDMGTTPYGIFRDGVGDTRIFSDGEFNNLQVIDIYYPADEYLYVIYRVYFYSKANTVSQYYFSETSINGTWVRALWNRAGSNLEFPYAATMYHDYDTEVYFITEVPTPQLRPYSELNSSMPIWFTLYETNPTTPSGSECMIYHRSDVPGEYNWWGYNSIGYIYDHDNESNHIQVIYSEDMSVWENGSVPYSLEKPEYQYGFADLYGEQVYTNSLLSTLNSLTAAGNQVVSSINTTLSTMNTAVSAMNTAVNSILYLSNRISDNTEDTADILDLIKRNVATSLTAIESGVTSANTLQSSANTTLTTIANRLTTQNNLLANWGVSENGNGSTSIGDSITATKAALEAQINTKEPFSTINAAYTWVQRTSSWSQAYSYYIDIPIPYAGDVRFDLGTVLLSYFGGIRIITLIQYCLTLPLMIGLLYASYSMVMRTFGGK